MTKESGVTLKWKKIDTLTTGTSRRFFRSNVQNRKEKNKTEKKENMNNGTCENIQRFPRFWASYAKSQTISRFVVVVVVKFLDQIIDGFIVFFFFSEMCLPEENQQPILRRRRFAEEVGILLDVSKHTFYHRKLTTTFSAKVSLSNTNDSFRMSNISTTTTKATTPPTKATTTFSTNRTRTPLSWAGRLVVAVGAQDRHTPFGVRVCVSAGWGLPSH